MYPSRGLMLMALLVLSCATACREQQHQDVASISRDVLANSEWQSEGDRCPSEVMAETEDTDFLKANGCQLPRLGACLSECADGRGGSCYWLANSLQDANAESRVYATLYQRACKLGVMSGCTNRAAGLHFEKPDDANIEVCLTSTYEKVCAFEDPWACTMYALNLTRGIGAPIDKAKALKALEKSCKYGPTDEACTYGMEIKAEIDGSEAGAEPST